MNKGCTIYVVGTIFTMFIGGLLSSLEDSIVLSDLFIGILLALMVGFYTLYYIMKPLKERFNPILVNILFFVLVLVAIFAALYILNEKTQPTVLCL